MITPTLYTLRKGLLCKPLTEFVKKVPMRICHKCGSKMGDGIAMVPTILVSGDFLGEGDYLILPEQEVPAVLRGRTMNPGPGVLRNVWKCHTCGHSEV